MGADGGIRITKISTIKRDWDDIRKRLVAYFEGDLKRCEDYEYEYLKKYLDQTNQLPKKIDKLSNEEVCELFRYLESCDCPYLYEDSIITGDGDYVASQMQTLSWALQDSVRIETWT